MDGTAIHGSEVKVRQPDKHDPTFEGGGFGLEPKAKPEITVMIEGVVTCKECRRRMVQTRTLAYSCVELATTDIVKYARDEVSAALEEEARKRGWDDRCGRCEPPLPKGRGFSSEFPQMSYLPGFRRNYLA